MFTRQHAEEVKARLAAWLAPRGLAFNEDKTRIVHLEEGGFDFLGFNVRRYHGRLVLIKPSKEAVRRIRKRLRTEMRALRGSNAAGVLKKLTPMYYGQFNPSKRNRWVFGDRDSGAYLPKFAWTKIVRHAMVTGTASPDDPALADYWLQRRRKQPPPPLSAPVRHLLGIQQGRCAACGGMLLHADQHPQSPHEWEQWVRVTLTAVRKQRIAAVTHGRTDEPRLIHAFCRRRNQTGGAEGPAILPA